MFKTIEGSMTVKYGL